MAAARFIRLLHRARDVRAARAFYTAVLGEPDIEIVPVPEAAAARGAPSHWLGAIGVDDVEGTVARFVARGATPLGPIQRDARGALATVRDPGGALIGFTTLSQATLYPRFAWSHLDARGAEATFALYAELLGWRKTEPFDLGAAGVVMQFAWHAGGPNVGSYVDLAPRPNHHPHWIFHFQVKSLDAAVAAVRGGGGVVMADLADAGGRRVVVCDDPQVGGFALCEG